MKRQNFENNGRGMYIPDMYSNVTYGGKRRFPVPQGSKDLRTPRWGPLPQGNRFRTDEETKKFITGVDLSPTVDSFAILQSEGTSVTAFLLSAFLRFEESSSKKLMLFEYSSLPPEWGHGKLDKIDR